MEKSLVSVLTPCYNTGNYVHRLLESVLQQTYPNIEMLVVDDGSTDNSVEVINSYIEKFKVKGYSLSVVHQENSGQSVAIREGLKMLHGKYIVWPDSDDFYASPLCIEQMVDAFEALGDDYGLVRTQQNVLEDGTLKVIGINGANAKNDIDKRLLFEDCLFCKNNFYFCPGAYMADFQKLKASTKEIYTDKNAGQNWQLMLPLLYHYRCYTIKERLYNVIQRTNSHSRGQYKGFEKLLTKTESYENTLLGTLERINNMPKDEKDIYSLHIKQKYCREKIRLAYVFRKEQEFKKWFQECESIGGITLKEKIYKTFYAFPFFVNRLYALKSFIANKYSKISQR